MSDNIGKNLKVLAIILFIVIEIGFFIATIIIWINSGGSTTIKGIAFAVLCGGTVVAVIIGFLMYGFGRLIENSERLSSQLDDISKQLSLLDYISKQLSYVKSDSSEPGNTV